MSFLLSKEVTKHQQRVANISKEFTLKLGHSKKDAAQIYLAALFHDIGKAKIDPKIYNKPGKLSEEEFKEIKKHPVESEYILKTLNMSEEIIKTVLYHHESYDGTGYPEGLKAEKIPYAARILKICDVYDALTNVRSYRSKPYTKDQALRIMEKMKNQFDEEIFNKFKIYINKKHNSSDEERRKIMKVNCLRRRKMSVS